MGGATAISNREEIGHAWRHWHAVLDENEYARPNIAVSETTFLGVLMQR